MATPYVTLAMLRANPDIKEAVFLPHHAEGDIDDCILRFDATIGLDEQGLCEDDFENLYYVDAVTCAQLGVQCRIKELFQRICEEKGVAGGKVRDLEAHKQLADSAGNLIETKEVQKTLRDLRSRLTTLCYGLAAVYLLLTRDDPLDNPVITDYTTILTYEIVLRGLLTMIEEKLVEM